MFLGDTMFQYDFSYDDILSLEECKREGILYDEGRFSFESYWEGGFNHYERLFYTDEKGLKSPFSGLLYDLFPDGSLSDYCYYVGGYEEGQHVEFYDNGQLSEYSVYNSSESEAFIIKWFRNGNISEVIQLTNHCSCKKFIKYDENGNIIEEGEKNDQ